MSYIRKENALAILLGATISLCGFWVVGQSTSEDEEQANHECAWNFEHDPVISTS